MDMARKLDSDDLEAALVAGLFLSAGGSGKKSVDRNRALGRMALDYAGVNLVALDDLAPNDWIITATAVGAPGFANPVIAPRDAVESARRLIALLDRRPAGVICGHVPGFNAWLVAASLGLNYVDAAANGRGHPTVKMGGMGLASRPDVSIIQVGVGGSETDGSRLNIVVEGNIVRTSTVMRNASVVNGGLIFASRGPITAEFAKRNGAAGAISFQLALGRAMLAAEGPARIRATADFLSGTCLVEGEVVSNSVAYGGGFDLGKLVVRGAQSEVVLGVYNEYMTADIDGRRVATFPDMIGSLDPETGEPVAIAELTVGSRVAIITAHRSQFPVGKGALDPAVFPEVEAAMGVDLQSYL
jgi:uncharacterized protein